MLHWVKELIDQYGYAIVVVLVMAEGVGLPLPGETALITAAAFSAQSHRLSIVGVILASFLGATGGGLGGYWIGRSGGLPFLTRHGKHVGITKERIGKARKFFTEHGPKAVFAARFIAILRMFAGLLAGVTNMRFWVFFLWNALGALAWSLLFGVLGYEFGDNLPKLEHLVGRTSLFVLGAVVVIALIVWHFRRSRKGRKSK
ncbi:MAG: DedA family protein [Gemmatimonadaceae bacterium]|nr:DedA family protein [Gemmatimonadaceae bacterium]